MDYSPMPLLFVPLEGFVPQPEPPIACSVCHLTPTQFDPQLGLCPHCAKVGYCSRRYQRWHWNFHRVVCPILRAEPLHLLYEAVPIVNEPLMRPSYNGRLSCYMPRPFTRLCYLTWLRDRPQPDVIKLLIDAFRMYASNRNSTLAATPNLYRNAPDSITGFQRFMVTAKGKPWLLPSWWNASDQSEAERLGLDTSDMNW